MSGIPTKTSNKAPIYIIGLVVSLAAFILLESWPGARTMMQHVDRSLKIVNLNWALLISTLLIGFLLGIGINKRR